MITRQRIILSLLDHAGGSASRLQFVKWAFLFGEERQDSAAFYQFVPYQVGPFSFTLYHEMAGLIRQQLIDAPDDRQLQLTAHGKAAAKALDPASQQAVDRFWRRYGGLPTAKLVDLVYRRHPWFTINSKRKDLRAVERPRAECAIYTAGYQGLQIEGLLNLLLTSGIEALIDVRHNPISRRYGFHKSTLGDLCGRLGLRYRHVPELGVPSAWRRHLDSPLDYSRLLARYEKEILPHVGRALETVAAQMTGRPSVLLCQEADPALCHRSRLARLLARLTFLAVSDLRTDP